MEKSTPIWQTHTSTSDLLTWNQPPSATNNHRISAVSQNASDGVSKVMVRGQNNAEEEECFTRRRQCFDHKLKEMSSSSIFGTDSEETITESSMNNFATHNRTSVRIVQQATNGISQISFSTEQRVSPKRATSASEVAKQRELIGMVYSQTDSKAGKHQTNAKSKELNGNQIFGPNSEIPPRSLAAGLSMGSKHVRDMREPPPRAVHTSVRVSNPGGGQSNIMFGEELAVKSTRNIHYQKFKNLTGNNIFQGDAPAGSTDTLSSQTKLKEMSGNDIFADGNAVNREHFAGVRKPPGGLEQPLH
ncbi:hypothetical protein Leryth_006444 [Lithospermum erythrorhizon]|nr:hypothetical protein Leryth_006444 [Lithospermum erythrorhizon]